MSQYLDGGGSCPVTGQLGDQAGLLGHCSCGVWFRKGKWNQTCCSKKCSDRAYNAAHPVARQRPLNFDAPSGWTPAERELSAHMRKRESRKARMLARLQQGEATTWELMQIGGSGWRSRLQELREDGKRDGYSIPPPENRLGYAIYRLEAKP